MRHSWSVASLARPMVSKGDGVVRPFLFSPPCIGPTEDFDPHLDLQMIKQKARRGRIGSFALFTIGLASEAALHGMSTPSSVTRAFFLRNSPLNMYGSVYLRLSNSCRCEVCADHEEPFAKKI